MQHLVYPKAQAKGVTLSDELMAAVPQLQPVPSPLDPTVLQAVFSLGVTPTEVILDVPDEAPEPEVAAVVAAHDPSQPSPQEKNVALVQQLYGQLHTAYEDWATLDAAAKDQALYQMLQATLILLARQSPVVTLGVEELPAGTYF